MLALRQKICTYNHIGVKNLCIKPELYNSISPPVPFPSLWRDTWAVVKMSNLVVVAAVVFFLVDHHHQHHQQKEMVMMIQVVHEMVEVVVDVREEEERKELSEKTEGCDDEHSPVLHHQAILLVQHSESFRNTVVCNYFLALNTPLLWPSTVLLSLLQSTFRLPSLLHCCRQTLLLH